ncbi:hypothetical protein [Roseobacter sp. N2S]|uniref:hypothetical protein n=1 Tax=Roseobacter sp. N2S TaxID=2663844 RepID=UPI002859F1C6|nr:hypothetical protein [Roseobacter sp. N2S]MDR6266517.1 hypothetical protein [Roseobacter sp. N2S]
MKLPSVFCVAMICLAPTAQAGALADMAGSWRGSGWVKQTDQGPQETIRCQIENTFDATRLKLTLSGICAVPGQKLTLSGTLNGTPNSTRITGRWSNPDGLGSVRVVGVEQADLIAFTFSTRDPVTEREISQNVEWRVTENTLHLRSADRTKADADTENLLSDVVFRK